MIGTRELLKRRLEEEKTRLQAELGQLNVASQVHAAGSASESGGYGNHMADDASETFELEKNLAIEKNLRDLLAKVNRGLHKFEAGTYGLCDECGQIIPEERLEALPHASLCIGCKARQEKDGKNGRGRK